MATDTDVIRFLCTNGHTLNVPRRLAGKKGKCPKCSVAFHVPRSIEEGEIPVDHEAERKAKEEERKAKKEKEKPKQALPHDSGVIGDYVPSEDDTRGIADDLPSPPVPEEPELGPGMFLFLCPNGHQLNGPVSLKGKLGQCPHCGEKFQIPGDPPPSVQPSYAANSTSDTAASLPSASTPELPAVLDDDDDLALPSADEYEPFDAYAPLDSQVGAGLGVSMIGAGNPSDSYVDDGLMEVPVEEIEEVEPPLDDAIHPLCQIVGRLWRTTGAAGEIRVTIKGGEVFRPAGFSSLLSERDFAVFALRIDNEHSVRIVPWASVEDVSIDSAEGPNKKLFDFIREV